MTAPLADRIRAVLALAEKAADGSDDHRCPNCGCYTNKAVEAIGRGGAQPMLQCKWCSTTWNRGARMEWNTPNRTTMAALLRECLANDGWRPISEAPRDVATIIATDGKQVSPIYWDPQQEYWCRDGNDWELDFKPTLWRPLPAAPGATPPDARCAP